MIAFSISLKPITGHLILPPHLVPLVSQPLRVISPYTQTAPVTVTVLTEAPGLQPDGVWQCTKMTPGKIILGPSFTKKITLNLWALV